jgi:outer membrane protein assembly factor BamD
MRHLRPLLYSLIALSLAVPVVQAELVWRPGEGWSDESGGDISASSSRDQLELAHKLEAQGEKDNALKAYKSLVRRWPLSFFAPEAQFRIGKILEDEGSFADAFKAFQLMVTKYPSSDYFEQALNEQYRIANLYLAGEPQRIWKIPVGPSMDKTVDMYERVIKNAPYGTYAPQCQFNIGLAREKQRKFSDAIDAYQKVLDNYPTSSAACNAQYQIGYAWMTSCQTGDYDMGAAKKAVDAFQDFLVRYPSSDKAAQAQENIQKLGQKQTQGAFDIAKFYETQHDPRGAFIYYNEVVREDPNSAQAQIAKKRIQELRVVVEALPGGLGPDGSGNLAAPQTVASNPANSSPVTPDNTPLPNAALPDPSANSALPSDPNDPMTSSSPGATASGDAPAIPPTTNAPSATTSAPASASAPATDSSPTAPVIPAPDTTSYPTSTPAPSAPTTPTSPSNSSPSASVPPVTDTPPTPAPSTPATPDKTHTTP